jgi:hypothetical protein
VFIGKDCKIYDNLDKKGGKDEKHWFFETSEKGW